MGQYFYVQDEAGNRRKAVQGMEHPEKDKAAPAAKFHYELEDGTPLRRVDSETFQIIGNGAYVHLVQ